jgi:hypothetical protein
LRCICCCWRFAREIQKPFARKLNVNPMPHSAISHSAAGKTERARKSRRRRTQRFTVFTPARHLQITTAFLSCTQCTTNALAL